MTIAALIEWHDALIDGKMMLRDIIDLETTFSSDPDEAGDLGGGDDEALSAEEPTEDDSDESEDPSDSSEEGDIEEAGISLSAMEEELLPVILKSFETIAQAYQKLKKTQDQRLEHIVAGQSVPSALERKYGKQRDEMIKLMEGVHLNNARIEYLVGHLGDLNKRLMMLEGKLLRTALDCKIKREDFLNAYYGSEMDPQWLDSCEETGQGVERFLGAPCRRGCKNSRSHYDPFG